MLNKPMSACLVAVLAAAPAFAQTATTPPPPMSTTTAPPPTSTMPSAGPSMSGNFVAKQEMGQMLASRLIGTTVVSQANETVGDVNDLLFDNKGQVMAAVIGVGGFLGIGEKNVAVPFQQLEFVANTADAPASTTTAPPVTTPPVTTAPSTGMSSTTATTGSTTTATAARRDAMPNRVMLRMTKADLQAAPTFEEYGRTPAATAPAGTTTSTPPRQ